MRVLILGGGGMLGHKLWQVFSRRFDTYVTFRKDFTAYARYNIFDATRARFGVDAFYFESLTRVVADLKPQVVVNAIGVIKQVAASTDPLACLTINSLLPHRLGHLCRAANARLIQISTDCVFSGRKGMYVEDDDSDATDLYGRTKYLGEVKEDGCITIRTSMIGRELDTRFGLVEWFMSSRSRRVHGYTNAIFSGFTTSALSEILADVISNHPTLSGVYHVSSDPISKYELLLRLKRAYGLDVEVEPYPDFQADRSLDSSRFRKATGFVPSAWDKMIEELASDPTPYEQWRNAHGA